MFSYKETRTAEVLIFRSHLDQYLRTHGVYKMTQRDYEQSYYHVGTKLIVYVSAICGKGLMNI